MFGDLTDRLGGIPFTTPVLVHALLPVLTEQRFLGFAVFEHPPFTLATKFPLSEAELFGHGARVGP